MMREAEGKEKGREIVHFWMADCVDHRGRVPDLTAEQHEKLVTHISAALNIRQHAAYEAGRREGLEAAAAIAAASASVRDPEAR